MNWEVTVGDNSTAVTAFANDTIGPTEDRPTDDFVITAADISLTVVISVVSGLGILGNFMVIFIVFYYRDMHSVINYSFANLALTDLTLLLLDGVPTAADTMKTNLSAKLGCNIPIYLQYISAEVSVLTLAFLSYDRYRLIVHPMKTIRRRSPKSLLKIFICIWLVSFITMIPTALAAGLTQEGTCSEYNASWGQEYFFTYILVSLYIFPSTVIIACYLMIGRKMMEAGPPSSMKASRRRRSVNMILIVIVLYALCWAPVHIVHMWMAFHPHVEARTPLYVELHTAANVLIFFNSSVNPFVYALVGPSFRRHIKLIAVSLAKCNPRDAFADNRSESIQSLYGERSGDKHGDKNGDKNEDKNVHENEDEEAAQAPEAAKTPENSTPGPLTGIVNCGIDESTWM